MSFRYDHDAALARVDVLENEVAFQRERADTRAAEAATLRSERDELRARVARLEAEQRPAKPEASQRPAKPGPVFESESSRRGERLAMLMLVGIWFAFIALNVVLAQLL